jgi:hypothetical protein
MMQPMEQVFGVTGQPFGRFVGWHGQVEGRRFDAYFGRKRLELFLEQVNGRDLSVGRLEGLAKAAAERLGQVALPLPEALEGLDAYGDPALLEHLVATVPDALVVLTRNPAEGAQAALVIGPSAVEWNCRNLDQADQAVLTELRGALIAVADAVAELPVGKIPEDPTRKRARTERETLAAQGRKIGVGCGAVAAVVIGGGLALWWALS